MTDLQVKDRVVSSDGETHSGVSRTSQTTADPVTGSTTRQSTTHMWSRTSPGGELVWLAAGIVLVLLAIDFAFHAFGASDVGFAAFVFSAGKFFAAPFAGIFNTSYTQPGNLLIWADVVAVVVYAFVAYVVAHLVGMVAGRGRA